MPWRPGRRPVCNPVHDNCAARRRADTSEALVCGSPCAMPHARAGSAPLSTAYPRLERRPAPPSRPEPGRSALFNLSTSSSPSWPRLPGAARRRRPGLSYCGRSIARRWAGCAATSSRNRCTRRSSDTSATCLVMRRLRVNPIALSLPPSECGTASLRQPFDPQRSGKSKPHGSRHSPSCA